MTTTQEPVLDETDYIAEAITEWFGARCPDFDPDCFCCRSWKQYDDLRAPAAVRVGWQAKPQHVAYFDDGQFHWMSGIAPRNCELYTRPASPAPTAPEVDVDRVLDASGDYMNAQYSNSALHHPTDRSRIKAALSTPPVAVSAVGEDIDDYELAETVHGEIVRICRSPKSIKEPATPPAPSGVVEALRHIQEQINACRVPSRNDAAFEAAVAALQSQPIAPAGGNAGLRGAAQTARESVASTLNVSIPDAPAGDVPVTETSELLKRAADHVEMAKAMGNFGIASSLVAELAAALSKQEPVVDAWCQPMDCGEHAPRKFIVRFADAEVGDAVFDDEAEAREFWERANTNWNCYLFGTMPLQAAAPKQGAK